MCGTLFIVMGDETLSPQRETRFGLPWPIF